MTPGRDERAKAKGVYPTERCREFLLKGDTIMEFIRKMVALMAMVMIDKELGFQEVDWSFWEDTFLSATEFVNSVVQMEVLVPIYKVEYEGSEYREKVTALDNTKRSKYEALEVSLSLMNRLCKKYGIEPFTEGTSPKEVTSFAGQFVGQVYFDAIGMTFWQSVEKAEGKDYPDEKVREILHRLS